MVRPRAKLLLTAIDRSRIETVQRRFTKRIPGLQSHSYHIRLTLLGIESLEARRLKADLLYVYKILFKYVDVDSESFFQCNRDRQWHKKLYTNYCRVNVRKHFFCSRIIAVWNALKMDPCNTKTLKVFKKILKIVDLSEYLHVFRKWRMSMVLYFSVYFFIGNICFTVFLVLYFPQYLVVQFCVLSSFYCSLVLVM